MTGIDESALTKGQRRKLNALRKSVGDDVGGTRVCGVAGVSERGRGRGGRGTRRRSSMCCGQWLRKAGLRSRAAATCWGAGVAGSSWRRRGRSRSGRDDHGGKRLGSMAAMNALLV